MTTGVQNRQEQIAVQLALLQQSMTGSRGMRRAVQNKYSQDDSREEHEVNYKSKRYI